MKKLLALSLSMIMALSLTAPAFAAPALSPEEAASIGVIGGADGPTAIITTGPIDLGSINWEDYGLEGMSPDSITWEELAKGLEQQAQAQRDELKKSLGGVPGQIGVMYNGEYVPFPDAAPEISGGRTMVPVRALVEALGGEVDYEFAGQEDTVRLFIDKYTISFTIGGATAVRHTRGTDTGEDDKTIEMDCAPYIKGGRTYVPVRFLAEALGCEVGWDAAYQTAILLDRAALAEQFDKQFTIMNKVQASRVAGWEKGRTLSTGIKGDVTVTAFDTLNGDKTYHADFDSQVLMDREAVSGSYSIELSDDIVDLLVEQYGYMDEEVLERMRLMAEALEDVEFIMGWDGQMWVKSPALDELGGEKDIWCGMELSSEGLQTVFVDADAATVGNTLAAMASTDSVMMWPQVGAMASVMELYRDENFTMSGGVSTLTIGLEDLAGVYEVLTGGSTVMEEALDLFKECEVVMKVDGSGGATVTFDMETEAQSGMPGIKMTMKAAQSGGKADLTMDVHVANTGEMKLTMSITQKTVSGKPLSEPPAGARIVDAPELLEP